MGQEPEKLSAEPPRQDLRDPAEFERENPGDLRRDIGDTRQDMDRTMEAIGDRVSPQRVYERRTYRVRRGFRDFRERIMGSPDYDYDEVGYTYDYGGGQGVEADRGSGLRDRASGRAQEAKERASGRGEQLKERASEGVSRAGEAPQQVRHRTQGNPLAAGLIAFGVGALAASVLPESNTERRAAERARSNLEPVKERLGEVGQGIKDDVADSAKQAVRDTALEGASAAKDVKDQAQQSGRAVGQDAKESAQQVRDQQD